MADLAPRPGEDLRARHLALFPSGGLCATDWRPMFEVIGNEFGKGARWPEPLGCDDLDAEDEDDE